MSGRRGMKQTKKHKRGSGKLTRMKYRSRENIKDKEDSE